MTKLSVAVYSADYEKQNKNMENNVNKASFVKVAEYIKYISDRHKYRIENIYAEANIQKLTVSFRKRRRENKKQNFKKNN